MRLLRWVCLGALWLTVWAPRLLGYEVTLELGRGVNLVAVPMEYESLVPVFTASDLARQTRSAIVARGVERDFGAPRFYTFLPSAGGFDFMVRPGSGLIVVSSMSQTVRLSVPEPVFPGRIETIAGTGAAGYSGDGGPATQAQLYIPTHLSLDSAGNIYILDAWNSAIRRVDARTGLISTIAGGRKVRDRNGAPIPTGDGGPAVDATFDCLFSIHVDPTDKLWITGCDTYRRIDLRTGLIDAPFQRLSFGRDVVVTADGTLYHSSDDPGGLYVTHPAGRTEMLLSWPDCQIQGGNERRLYFAQLGGDTLYEFDLGTRKVRHLVGRGYSDLGLDGQAPRDTGFFGIDSVVEDQEGNVYIADRDPNRIRRWDRRTGNTTTVAGDSYVYWPGGQWQGRYRGDGGPATLASFYGPASPCLEPDGSLLLADCGNNCVRRISARPEPPTSRPQHQVYLTRGFNVFSVPPSPGVTRPILASEVARLTNSPFVVRTVARDGVSRFEAYVTSQPATDFEVPTTCAVGVVCGSGRSVDLTRRGELRPGDILTIAGTGKPGFSGDGGPAFTAQLNRPSSLALDSRGRLLVADLFNHRVRRIDLVTGQIETVAGNGRMDFSTDAASATEVPVARPGVLCVDAGDNLFIAADWQIVRADARTGALTVVAKMWDIPVQLTGTDMALPSIMVASPTGEVFFKDRITLAIYRAGPVPPNISVVTGRGMEAPTTAGIDLDASRVADVSDMTLDGPDRLRLHGIREWVADLAARKIYLLPGPRRESYEYARSLPDGTLLGVNYNESRIWRVPPAGPATLLAGDGYCQSRTADGNGRHAGDGGPAISASLSGPKAVSLDADGNLYIADASNHVIRMIVGPKGPPRLVRAR